MATVRVFRSGYFRPYLPATPAKEEKEK